MGINFVSINEGYKRRSKIVKFTVESRSSLVISQAKKKKKMNRQDDIEWDSVDEDELIRACEEAEMNAAIALEQRGGGSGKRVLYF